MLQKIDHLGIAVRSIKETRAFYEEIPCDSKKFAVLPGAKHAHFEENSFEPMYNWIKEMSDLEFRFKSTI